MDQQIKSLDCLCGVDLLVFQVSHLAAVTRNHGPVLGVVVRTSAPGARRRRASHRPGPLGRGHTCELTRSGAHPGAGVSRGAGG